MGAADKIALIDDVRLSLHTAAELAIAQPETATWDDVEANMLSHPRWVENIRSFVERCGHNWRADVRDEWMAKADEIEAGFARHAHSEAHGAWLESGGPARLWAVFQRRIEDAQLLGTVVVSDSPVSDAETNANSLAKWRQSELVRLYLGEVS
jgi:hypothetical protein